MSRGRWFILLLSFALMFAATAYVLRASWPEGGMPLLAWQAHVGAIVTVIIEVTTRALKIMASARATDVPLSFGTSLRVCLAGDFAAAITPARAGAEPARFLVLAESGVGAAPRVIVLFLELFLEVWSLAVVCLTLAFLFGGTGVSSAALLALVGGYSTVVIAAGAAGFLLARHRSHGPPPGWLRTLGMNAGRWRAVQRTLRQLRASIESLRHANGPLMFLAFIGSVIHVICKVATLPMLVWLGDPGFVVTRESLAPLVLWPLALFYGGVVVPAPGGGGFIEGAFALTLEDAIPAGVFAATLLWWRFYTFYLYVIIGGIAAGGAALRAIRGKAHSA